MKRSQVSISKVISVPPDAAWEVIGAVDGVEKWFAPVITSCRLEGNKRICGTEGGEFTEDIIKVDHENRVFNYGIPKQHMMPIQNILGTMKVTDNNGNANIEWSWTFDVEEKDEVQAKEMLAGAGEVGIAGIEAYSKSLV